MKVTWTRNSLSQAGLALYPEEDRELYRRAHWVYENIKNNCPERIPKKTLDRMTRDSMFIALAGRFNAILVTRDWFLYSAIVCLRSQGSREYSSVWIYVNPSRRMVDVRICAAEPSCILERVEEAASALGWSVNTGKDC